MVRWEELMTNSNIFKNKKLWKRVLAGALAGLIAITSTNLDFAAMRAYATESVADPTPTPTSAPEGEGPEVSPTVTPETMVTPEVTPTVTPETTVTPEVTPTDTPEVTPTVTPEATVTPTIAPKKLLGAPKAAPAPADKGTLLFDGEPFGQRTIKYGDKLNLSVAGVTSEITYKSLPSSKDPDFDAWDDVVLSDGYCLLAPGTYYFGYTASDGQNKRFDCELTVEKATIGSAYKIELKRINKAADEREFNLHIECEFPKNTETDGYIESGAVLSQYHFELYKKDGEAFKKTGDGDNTSEKVLDITDIVKNHGYGTYKVSVSFTSGKPDYYLSSNESFSNEFVYKDEYMPEITDYTYSESEGNYSLTATISDTGSGLAMYAFSTATSSEGVDDWTSVADADKASSLPVTKKIEEGGIYYLYVKDIYGNCTKSDKSIAVTKLIYHNMYSGSALMSPQPVDYLLARSDEDKSIDIRTAVRKGHTFLKWTTTVDSVDNTLEESIKIDKKNATYWGKTVDLAAEWSMNTVTVKVSCDDDDCVTETGKVYNASDVTLSAIISGIDKEAEDTDVTYEYQWYYSKDGESYTAISENGTNSTYLVKNVNQSGFYKVEVTVTVGDAKSDIATGILDKKVTITKKPLSISVNPKTITFGDELPAEMSAYTFAYDGLVEGDAASVTHNDEVPAVESSDYTAGSSVGTNAYKIKPHGFTSDNYDITMSEAQNLSVTPKDASGFSVTLDNNSYNYDGNPKKPVPALIKDGDTVLLDINADPTVNKIKGGENEQQEYDYILSYPAPTLAGNTKVVLAFRGNYKGNIEVPYTISQSGYDVNVTINGWKYGEFNPETNSPVVVPKINGTEAPIDILDKNKHFVYRTVTGESTYSAEYQDMPMDAGKYQVKVRIDELANYTAQESDWTDFEITKRNIILKSEDYTWGFDNNTHSSAEKNPVTVSVLDTYTKDGIEYRNDGLKDPDHYAQNPAANVTVKEVNGEGVPNAISYSFTTSTKASNYNVITVEGTLKVVPATLVAPSELQWNSINTGTATWVGVTKSGVTIEYHVRLYKDSTLIKPSSGSEYYKTSDVDSFVTTKTNIDFKDIIRSNSEDSLGTYTFTVRAVPVYGEDSVRNYKASAFSAPSAGLHTAKIEMDKTTGVAAALVADSLAYVIIEGESLNITMEPAEGYTEADPAWVVTNLTEESNVEKLVIKDAKDKTTSVTFARGASDNMQFKVVAHANDVAPTSAWDFGPDYTGSSKDSEGKSYTDDMSRIYVNISMTDAIGVTKYRIVEVANESDFETNKTSYETLDSNWTDVPSESKTSYSFNYKITDPGSYYVGAVDDTGSITWSEPCTVYQIDFEHGDVDEAKADGDMQSILKVKDFDIVHLPANEFTYSGFAFTEWKVKDADRVYVDGGMYPLNVSTTLVAKWSDKKYPYTINYHLMSVDGTYPDAASETKEFTSLYGQKQFYTKSAANRDVTGYSIDSIKMGDEVISKQVTEEGKTRTDAEINITTEGQVYDVYYKRNEYTVKYKYTDENNEVYELTHKENYLYEKALSVAEETGENLANAEINAVAASKPGYRFTGWTYDGSGTRPTNMPAHDVIVTGKFVPEEARYNVHYYVKSANGSDYSEREDLAHTYSGSHDEEIIFKTESGESDSENTFVPEKIDGYNFKGIAAVNGAGSPEESSMKAITKKVNAKEGETLNIYYFCEPAEYTVILNVWLGSDHAKKMYSGTWSYKYGQTLSSDMINEMSKYYEDYHNKGLTASHISAPTNVMSSGESTVGYILSDSISWSTGTAPAVMPAGNINITREYVKDAPLEYLVHVYFENSTGEYNATPDNTASYFVDEGNSISVITDLEAEIPADDYANVYIKQFKGLKYEFNYYTFDKVTKIVNSNEVDVTGPEAVNKVSDGKGDLELNVYFKRQTYNLTVNYYADGVKIGNNAVDNLRGVWGERITKTKIVDDKTVFDEGFDPLKYFDSKDYTVDVTIDGVTTKKTYKDAAYVVSYRYSGYKNGSYFRYTYNFDQKGCLSSWYSSDKCKNATFGTDDTYQINVYYIKMDEARDFALDVKMNIYDGYTNDNVIKLDADKNIQYYGRLRGETEDTPYTYQIVNRSRIYGMPGKKEADPDYPGLATLLNPNGTYGTQSSDYTSVTDTLRAYNPVSGETDNCEYFIKSSGTEKIIYIIPSNSAYYEMLWKDIYYELNINSSAPYRQALSYMNDYNAQEKNTVKIKWNNTGAEGRNVENASGVLVNNALTYNFYRTETVTLYHYVINSPCGGHPFSKGSRPTYSQLTTCDKLEQNKLVKPGYDLKLFDTKEYENEVTADSIPSKLNPMNNSESLFAQYFKKTIPHNKYIYFELADSVVSGGEEINYLDKSMVSSVTDGKATATVGGKNLELDVSKAPGTSYTISYEQNGRTYNQTVTPSIDTYTYNGSPVMVVEHHENYSFTSISLDTATYEQTGVFSFDSKAGNNVTNAYIESSAIDLIAHYERVNYSISSDDNNVDNSEDFAVRNTYKNGQTVRLNTPVFNGYDFDGWTITDTDKNAEDLDVKYYNNSDAEVEASEATYALLTMPTKDIKAIAQWVPGAVNLKYLYYFQNSSKQYEETYIDTLLACPDSKIKDVELPFDGVSTTLKGYHSASDVLLGVSKDGYFYKVVNEAVDSSNLVGMIKNVASTTGAKAAFGEEYVSDVVKELYELNSATCTNEITHDVVKKSADVNNFTVSYGQVIKSYYARTMTYSVNLVGKATDNSEADVTLAKSIADGSIFYGDSLTISATPAVGYKFIGWYLASDVIADDKLIAGYASKTKYNSSPSFEVVVKSDLNLVAVVEPEAFSTPPEKFANDVKISLSTENYTYDYGYTDGKNLHAAVEIPTTANKAIYVSKYSWYKSNESGEKVGDPIQVSELSDYKFNEKNAGTYYYTCEVEFKRKDNGRTINVRSKTPPVLKIEVTPVEIKVKVTSVNCVYDGENHKINVELDKENYPYLSEIDGKYTIVYSEAPIDEGNIGSSTEITKKDVKLDGEDNRSSDPYTIYYSVVPNDVIKANYVTASGTGTIKISPKTVTVKETANGFNKLFDDTEEVTGDLSTLSSDKYKLSYGKESEKYYALTGICACDTDFVTMDFEANYNSKHVNDAGTVTLTDLKIVNNSDKKENLNYKFADGDKLVIPGEITQKELDVTWNIDSGDSCARMDATGIHYAYNGQTHLPVPSISTGVPAGFELVANNGNINAGTYTAIASLKANAEDADPKDYKLNKASCEYKINVLAVTITAKNKTDFEYDRTSHTLTEFIVNDGTVDKTLSSGADINSNYSFTAKVAQKVDDDVKKDITSVINAGTYTMEPIDVKIIDKAGKDVTDNFNLTINAGTLIINKKPVTVEGITVSSRKYDGTTKATPVFGEGVKINGVIEGDKLRLDQSKITAKFKDANVGTEKDVLVSIPENALIDVSTGAVSINYTVEKAEGKEAYEQSAKQDITIANAILTLGVEDINANYGGEIDFKVVAGSESGLSDATSDIDVWGDVVFTIKDSDGKVVKTFTHAIAESSKVKLNTLEDIKTATIKLQTGTYKVSVDVKDLKSQNYTFANTATVSKLKIGAKVITLNPVVSVPAGKGLSKSYDKTIDVSDELKDKIKLNDSNAYFTFDGIEGGDEVSLTTFDAIFDDSNVKSETVTGATKITISNIEISNPNYSIASDATLDIPASITPVGLTLTVQPVTAIYGDTKKSVLDKAEVKASGLISEDTLAGVVSYEFSTEYDDKDLAKRGITTETNSYQIKLTNVALLGNANYDITTVPATLKINPKTVKVSVAQGTLDESVNYTKGNPGASSIVEQNDNFSMTYGGSISPNWFKPQFDGFVYNEGEAASVALQDKVAYKINLKHEIVIKKDEPAKTPDIAGYYKITPDLTEVEMVNYTFKPVADTYMIINKKRIELSHEFITVIEKVYDGKQTVPANKIRFEKNNDIEMSYAENTETDTDLRGDKAAIEDYDYLQNGTVGGNQILPGDIAFLKEHNLTGLIFDPTKTLFDDANVKYTGTTIAEHDITLEYNLCNYLDDRYVIVTTPVRQTKATAKIIPAPLTIKAKVKTGNGVFEIDGVPTLYYGTAVPEFENEYKTFVGKETTQVLKREGVEPSDVGTTKENATTGEKWRTTYKGVVNDYSQANESGVEYTVIPYGFDKDTNNNNNNYTITYENCTFKVITAKLATPNVTWVSGKPGIVKFAGVSNIGDVEVDHYVLNLYKEGQVDAIKTVTSAVVGEEYNLLEDIRTSGPGGYKVGVTAYAKTENNASYTNVAANSDEGKSSVIYAAELTLKPATDDEKSADTVKKSMSAANDDNRVKMEVQKASDKTKNSAYITSADSAVKVTVVQGEKIPVSLDTPDKTNSNVLFTGYRVLKLSSENAKVTFDSSEEAKTWPYSNAINIGAIGSASLIEVNVSFNHVEAAISASLVMSNHQGEVKTGLSDTFMYGYSAVPDMTVNVAIDTTNDTVGADGYTYSYVWHVNEQGPGLVPEGEKSKILYFSDTSDSDATSCTQKIKTGVKVGVYSVYCTVTAKRKDNGIATTYDTLKVLGKNDGLFRINITPSPLTAHVVMSKASWTYGEERATVSIDGISEDSVYQAGSTDIKYYYSNTSDLGDPEEWSETSHPSNWSTTMITDANTAENPKWYVVAYIPPQPNYSQLVTVAQPYTISKATLGKASDILLSTDKDSYGKVQWTAASTINENTDATPTASSVVPNYEVTVKWRATSGADFTDITNGTFNVGTSVEANITDLMQNNGEYEITIKSVPNASNAKDVQNSESKNPDSIVKADFKVGNITVPKGEQYEKTYDGNPITLTASFEDTVDSYQWYVTKSTGTEPVSGAESATVDITNVDDSGKYFCVGTKDSLSYVTVLKEVKINKRNLTITATAKEDYVYDGTEKTSEVYTNSDDLQNGDKITSVKFSGKRTDAGTVDNVPSAAVIKNSDDSIDETNNYNITYVKANLTVNPLPVTLTWSKDGGDWTGFATTYTSSERSVTASVSNKVNDDDVSVDTYESTGSNVNKATNQGTYTAIANKLTGDKANNYTLTGATGNNQSWTINKADIQFTAGAEGSTNSWIYDGADHKNNTYKISSGSLQGSDSVASVTYGTSSVVKNVSDSGTTKNTIAAVTIKNGETDVTGNYNISYVAGPLTITKRAIKLTAKNKSSVYGADLSDLEYTSSLVSEGASGDAIIAADKDGLGIKLTTTATKSSPVDYYPIKIEFTENGNYDITLEHDNATADATYGRYEITKAALNVTANGYEGVYDGSAHGISVTATAPAGGTPTIYYSTSEITDGNYGSASTENITYTEVKEPGDNDNEAVGSYTVYYYVKCDNYNSVKGSKTVKITKRPITLTAKTGSHEYDGVAYSLKEYDVTSDTKVASTDKIDSVSMTASVTNVDDYAENNNTISDAKIVRVADDTKVVTDNYKITYVAGKISITKATDTITVTNDIGKVYSGTPVDSPTYSHDTKNNGTASYIYYKKTGETYTAMTGSEVPTNAGDYAVEVKIIGDNNYVVSTSAKKDFTITKKPITITAKSVTDKVYDGKPLTFVGKTVSEGIEDSGALCTGHTLKSITFSGSVTDVADVAVDNAISNAFICTNDNKTVNLADNYNITYTAGKLKVVPHSLDRIKLNGKTDNTAEVIFTGEAVGPTIVVEADGIKGATKTLTKDTDYTVTVSDTYKPTAIYPGEYTVQVVGKGNYTGDLTLKYTIKDKAAPVISGVADELDTISKNIYCKDMPVIKVSDKMLAKVEVKVGDEVKKTYTFDPLDPSTPKDSEGNVVQEINSTDLIPSAEGTTYTIVGTDTSGNSKSVSVKVYSDHSFVTYNKVTDTSDPNYNSNGLHVVSDCSHNCGGKDYKVKMWGSVEWDYDYPDPNGSGETFVQGVDAREIAAKVELLQDDVAIGEPIIVNCADTCGTGAASPLPTDFRKFEFGLQPLKDATHDYVYTFKVTIGDLKDGNFVEPTNDLHYAKDTKTDYADEDVGHRTIFRYAPSSFDLPWKIVLKDLPVDEDGNTVAPEKVYVKVLFAYTEDADDTDSPAGYQVITQHSGTISVECGGHDNGDGTYTYEGSYPVWMYQGAKHVSYYYRVQVVGYELDNENYDVTAQGLKSINDKDHEKHTIYYTGTGPSGTITYELNNLLPTLTFDSNNGSDKAFAVIWKGKVGGEVTAAEINAVGKPSYAGYNFVGWYDSKEGGNPVSGDITIGSSNITLYARWSKIASPDNSSDGDDDSTPAPAPAKPKVTPSPVVPEIIAIASPAPSRTQNNPQVTLAVTPAAGDGSTDNGDDSGNETGIAGNVSVSVAHRSEESEATGLEVAVVDEDHVANATLTDDEKKYVENGGNVEIRLVVDNKLTGVANGNDEDIFGNNTKLKSYVSLILEKRVGDGDWERLYRASEPIAVEITIPEELIEEGEKIVLVRITEDGYEYIDDLSDDSLKIMFITNDFESEYALISIPEAQTGTLFNDCPFHWYLLIILLLSTGTVLLYWKKDEDEVDENGKPIKRRGKGHMAAVVLINGVGAVLVYFGHCHYDLPILLASIGIAAIGEVIPQFKKK